MLKYEMSGLHASVSTPLGPDVRCDRHALRSFLRYSVASQTQGLDKLHALAHHVLATDAGELTAAHAKLTAQWKDAVTLARVWRLWKLELLLHAARHAGVTVAPLSMAPDVDEHLITSISQWNSTLRQSLVAK